MKLKKEPHVIVTKKFVFRMERKVPRSSIGNKEMKWAKRQVQQQYRAWMHRFLKKWGVIGPDKLPEATAPIVTDDGWTLAVSLVADFIVHRRRKQWESFLRNIRPKNIIIRMAGMAGKEEEK